MRASADMVTDPRGAPWRDAIVLEPTIRRNIKLAESPSFGATIFEYAPDSNGAADYRALAMSVVKQAVRGGPRG